MKNVAVFGAGRIGRIHAANVAALPGVHLKFICDPVTEAAAQLAAQLGASTSTPEAVLTDPSIAAVVIASPTDTHSDLINRAAAARKHIFCEKPIDLSVPRAVACAGAVKAAGVACMIGFQRRFDPTFNAAKERLARGDIGAPEMLVVTSRDPGAPPAQYLKGSGGIFRDMLIPFLQRYREAYRLELAHFFEHLQNGKPFRTGVDDGVAAQKLADAAAQSLASGQVVRL